MDAAALHKWETLQRSMNIDTQFRIGSWMNAAAETIALRNPDFSALVPAPLAAMYLCIPEEEVWSYVAQNFIAHEDLGVLGLFVYKSEIPAYSDAR